MLRLWLLCLLSFISVSAIAKVDNGCEPVNGTSQMSISLGDMEAPSQGSILVGDWNLGGGTLSVCACTAKQSIVSIFKADYTFPTTPHGGGWYSLNEFFEIRTHMFIGGNVNQLQVLPFNDISSEVYEICPDDGQIRGVFNSGSKGQAEFKLVKPLLGSFQFNSVQLFSVYARKDISGGYGSIPIASITLEPFSISVLEKCQINAGQIIEFNFDNIPATDLDGTNHSQTKALEVDCEGGAFEEQGRVGLDVELYGQGADFNADYLKTSVSDLAFVFRDEYGKVVKINNNTENHSFVVENGVGTFSLTAAPVANAGETLQEQAFSATASLIIVFP